MASGKVQRGEMIIRTHSDKSNFITNEVYVGKIDRSYQKHPKYNIAPKKGIPYSINSPLTMEQLKAKYPDAVVTPVVLNLVK